MRTAQAGFKSGKGGLTAADILVRMGPTLRMDVGLKPARPVHPPDLPSKGLLALIDTGAGADGIDDDLARRLGLPVVDEVEISGIGGKHRAPVYMARVYIPELDRLLFQRFTGVLLAQGGQDHRVLLGRGFLRRYRLSYDGETADVAINEIP